MTQEIELSDEHKSTVQNVCEHLKLLGYEVIPANDNPQFFTVRGFSRGGFYMHIMQPNIVMITTLYNYNDIANEDRLGFLEYVNALNTGSTLVKCNAEPNGRMYAQAVFCAAYEKTSFGQFLRVWDEDLAKIFSHEKSPTFFS